jgi:V-type H+-transporting ATPase subunit G
MDANRRQSGIQQLLAAEQEAQQIVNAARAGNTILLSAQILQIKHNAREQVPCA